MDYIIDIIIPCYNAKDSIFETLSSISIQNNAPSFKVYLINDKSDYDYSEEVNYFSKFFPIEEIKLDKNLGPGASRHEGINRSKSPYIMFIDSDDILYSAESLLYLYAGIENSDLVISNFIYQRDNIVTIKKENAIWLHGKLYRRSFLEKYNINFNDSRSNEDNGFNRLVLLMNPKIYYLDEITYVYRENKNSITRKNNRKYKIFGLEGFVYNMKWAIDEALDRGMNPKVVPYLANNFLVALYLDYLCYIDDSDSNNILKYSKELIPYYKKIKKEMLVDMIYKRSKELEKENRKPDITLSFDQFIERVSACD